MKSKKKNIVLIIVCITLIFLLSALLVFGIINYSKGKNFISLNSKTELLKSKTYEKLNAIAVDSRSVDVTLKKSNDDNIEIKIYGTKKEQFEIVENNQGINLNAKSNICIGFCLNESQIIIYLPNTTDIKVNITTKSGDVIVEELNLSNIEIETSSGDINVSKLNNINARTTSGDIDISYIKEAKLQSKSGDIKIGTVDNSTYIETSSGDINITSLKGLGKLTSDSGDIVVKLNGEFYIETNTKKGDISNNASNNRYAPNTISISTRIGDIEIN